MKNKKTNNWIEGMRCCSLDARVAARSMRSFFLALRTLSRMSRSVAVTLEISVFNQGCLADRLYHLHLSVLFVVFTVFHHSPLYASALSNVLSVSFLSDHTASTGG